MARNDIHQPSPLVTGQRLTCGDLAHQLRCRFQLPGILLERLAINGLATGQVLLEGLRGPDTKPGCLSGVDPIPDRHDHIETVELHRTCACRFPSRRTVSILETVARELSSRVA